MENLLLTIKRFALPEIKKGLSCFFFCFMLALISLGKKHVSRLALYDVELKMSVGKIFKQEIGTFVSENSEASQQI